MKKKGIRFISSYLVLLVLLLGFFLRAYNINWGAPFYFHPDERNIASLLSQNPLQDFPSYIFIGTFSYGNFLTTVLQIPKLLITSISPSFDLFTLSILLVRYTSVFFATLTLFILYKAGSLFSKQAGIIALLLGTFSTGLIQNAHFGTFDTFVTFFIFLAFYFSLQLIKTFKLRHFLFAVGALILASAAKITSITFFPILFLAFLVVLKKKRVSLKKFVTTTIIGVLLFTLVPLLSPYYTTLDFRGLLEYERGVVAGTLPVFYTQSFNDTLPFIFQFTDIYPFLLNPLATILFPISLIVCCIAFIKTRDNKILLTLLSFLILFIPQAVLFAKWSRYMLPTLPFIYLFLAIALSYCATLKKHIYKKLVYTLTSVLVVFSVLHSIGYLILTKDSSVVTASLWARKHIPNTSSAISEQYDLGLIPFNNVFRGIALYDFYGMEEKPQSATEIALLTRSTDYILLPSQRILKSRIANESQFPIGNTFYSSLYFGRGGFKKVYETPCSWLCQFVYVGSPVLRSEETISVFDRPIVTIYERVK